MKRFRLIWDLCFVLALTGFTGYALADTFLISRVYQVVDAAEESSAVAQEETAESEAGTTGNGITSSEADTESDSSVGWSSSDTGDIGSGNDSSTQSNEDSSLSGNADESESAAIDSDTESSAASWTADSYSDEHIQVTVSEYRAYDTTIHVADVVVDSPEYLKTYLAQNAYGRNVTEKTSDMAADTGAILAINGDYYGTQERGYVIRNGVLYRDTAESGQEDLVIYGDGSFNIVSEDEVTAAELVEQGAVQVLSFGPSLVENGQVSVSEYDEVDRSMASNPRTAIGQIGENHYVFVVSDGRTSEDTGLSLYQLAQVMEDLGVETAYNLDGGGSSTMVFGGEVINTPTGGHGGHSARGSGSGASERAVSDMIYIGY